MTANDRWFLPEGIEEILPPAALRLEHMRRDLLDLFHSWGYGLVHPPLIEYLDTLLAGTGHDLDVQTFKLVDQLNGRMMGVRADITPQIARIDAHNLPTDAPQRFCYLGPVLNARGTGDGGRRNPLQLGVELFGHAGVDSDAEVLSLMMATLEKAGIRNFHIDLGHVGIYRALCDAAGLDKQAESQLFNALQRKACTEVQELLKALELSEQAQGWLSALPELNGDESVLAQARELLAGAPQAVAAALDQLEAMAATVRRLRPDHPLYFDLAELRGFHYHSGLVFAAFVPGLGHEVARGGRYDQVGEAFGRSRPATGFGADLKTLMMLTQASGSAPGGIFAPAGDDAGLAECIQNLREQGERVVIELAGQAGGAVEMGCDKTLTLKDGQWQVVDV